MKCGIIIMVKVPVAGAVKTRLQPFLTPDQSAELANCLLQDAIDKAESLKNKLIIAYSPAERRGFFDSLTNHNFVLVAQNGQSLGERMFNAFEFAFSQHLDSIVMIGTDSPTFPGEFLRQAFDFLEASDAVLGKTDDGGYYLIGLRKLDRRVFENVEWSSAQVFEQTKQNIEKLGFSLEELPGWYDIDEPKDLERLREDDLLKQAAPKTFNWLKKFLTTDSCR